jgi:copper resistance protein B
VGTGLTAGLALAQGIQPKTAVSRQQPAEQAPMTGANQSKVEASKPAPSMEATGNAPAVLQSGAGDGGGPTMGPNPSEKSTWPSPVADNANYSYVLFDLLEYQRIRGINAFRWDALGWYGGDKQRVWIKSEGELYGSSRSGGEADVQVLYGRLIAPFFDLQAGVRYEKHVENNNPQRVFAVVGLQGLAPGRFDIEPAFFISNKGKTSLRFTGTYETLLTQRLILQPRFETEIAFQRDSEFGVARGVNDVEVGLRLRYEVRRELAPYFGITFRQSFDATAQRVLREGGVPNALEFVIGLRMWH